MAAAVLISASDMEEDRVVVVVVVAGCCLVGLVVAGKHALLDDAGLGKKPRTVEVGQQMKKARQAARAVVVRHMVVMR